MPRLAHRPPAYCLHKSTHQAVVSLNGSKIYLGPYGSRRSLQRYQEVLKQWEQARHRRAKEVTDFGEAIESVNSQPVVVSLTAAQLRDKRLAGRPITISELIFVYRRHTHEYYRKNGEVTREAGAIDDSLRILRRHYRKTFVSDFGPVALDALREKMIDELDWSRKCLNKQVNRIRGMFQWAGSKEIVDSDLPLSLRQLSGLKKGRTRARETARVTTVSDKVIEATIAALPQVVSDKAFACVLFLLP